MILNHDLTIEAPTDRVWSLLDQLDSVIACMPGASYVGPEGEDNKANIKVKVGAITANFQGKFRFLEKNEAEHSVLIRGSGRDTGGKASANATINIKLEPQSSMQTRALVKTDLAMTGPLAQFGSGVITDVASRMVEQFVQNLNAAVVARSPNTGDARDESLYAGSVEKSQVESKAFDVSGVLAKRGLAYAAGGVAALVLIGLLVRFL